MSTRAAAVVAFVIAVLAASVVPAGAVAGFGDVDEGRYFTAPVQWMVDEEITTGTSATCFSPWNPVSRGEAAAFLWRMEGEPDAPAHPFTDVTKGWQQGPVSWMYAEGITTGTTASTYSPERTLTRGEFAALLHRHAGEPSAASDHGFGDVTRSWQQVPVSWLAAEGITNGTSDSEFSPDDPVTRGQFAAFLHRYAGSPAVSIDAASPACPGDGTGGSTDGGGSTGGDGSAGGGGSTGGDGTTPEPDDLAAVDGFNSLFIGHSFFRPMAQQMPALTAAAGIDDHTQEIVFAGSSAGAPEAMWDNASRRSEVQRVLDSGDVDLFVLSWHGEYPTSAGYYPWFDYALEANPDTAFAIAIPWIGDPGRFSVASYEVASNFYYDTTAPPLVDELRAAYPGVTIFSIPDAVVVAEVWGSFEAGEIPDLSSMTGSGGTGVFRDARGHAGPLLEDVISLVWLEAIYGVDPTRFDSGHGWQTDIHALAADIFDSHDPDYDAPWR